MKLDPKVQRIIDWRESFATLPDSHFFSLVRMYLGEIKTPYNKQKLIEQLGAFIRKEENKKNLIAFLNEEDIIIINAVNFITDATQDKLASFFSGTYSYATLYEKILNLEERLILYRHEDKASDKTLISLNPLLEETLAPYISFNKILPKTVFSEEYESIPFTINPQFIASFISFALSHHDMCKGDGAFKKRALTELEQIYSNSETNEEIENRIQHLCSAFCNLNLFHFDDDGISVDKKRVELFASLSSLTQYVYLSVASCGHFSRSSLQLNAQLLLNLLSAIPKDGFTKTGLVRLAFLLKEKTGILENDFSSNDRFAQILENNLSEREVSNSSGLNDGGVFECLVDSCITFGILFTAGVDENGDDVFAVSPLISKNKSSLESQKVLSIDAGFSITIMPGLSLAELLPLTYFMDCVRYDTAAVFEINKRSVMRAFDSSCTPKEIFSLLEKYSAYELSQNLKFSIEEWYHSYSSGTLYKGYVLKVSEDKCVLVEKNPVLSPYIKLNLAPGIYLLDFANDEDAKNLIQKSGLDFIGNIKTVQPEKTIVGLPELTLNNFSVKEQTSEKEQALLSSEEERQKIISSLSEQLKEMNLSAEQEEGLEERIENRIILNPEQLRGTSVRFEKLEATGMDYNGKLHVIDSAMSNDCMIEIECEGNKAPLVGTPVSLDKQESSATVKVRLEPDHTVKEISVGTATRIKKLRGQIKHSMTK